MRSLKLILAMVFFSCTNILRAETIEQIFKIAAPQEITMIVGAEKRVVKVNPGDELRVSFADSTPATSKEKCISAYGRTECGYGCVAAYGQIKCGKKPDMQCLADYGNIECGYDCKSGYGQVGCAASPTGKCAAAYGKVTCSDKAN